MGSVFLLLLHVLKENGIFTPSSNFTDTVHKDQIVHMSDFLNLKYCGGQHLSEESNPTGMIFQGGKQRYPNGE